MLVRAVNGEEINFSNVGIFYNKDNSKAECFAEKVSKIFADKNIKTQILTTDNFTSNDIQFNRMHIFSTHILICSFQSDID